jgi:hypothetical protein
MTATIPIPAAHRDHPINAVLRPECGETFRELARQVEYCEITWPQCWMGGEAIYLESKRKDNQ